VLLATSCGAVHSTNEIQILVDDVAGNFCLSRTAGAAVAAAARGHQRVLRAMLDAGLEADAMDEHGWAVQVASIKTRVESTPGFSA